ncbi:MAG: AEC family transporter, partial [Microbacteriaceae bacterium]
MLSVAAGFTIIFLIAGAGYALRRTNFLDASAVPIIHKLTFFILTPSLFFTALATADIHVLLSTYFPVVAAVSVVGLVV